MNNIEDIKRGLSSYMVYKFSIAGYETPDEPEDKYMNASRARGTLYSETPLGTGGGSKPPKLSGRWSLEDALEYERLKCIVQRLEMALDMLPVLERDIIRLKYFAGLTLAQVGERKSYSRESIKSRHRKALAILTDCLLFDDIPYIDNILPPNVPPTRGIVVISG